MVSLEQAVARNAVRAVNIGKGDIVWITASERTLGYANSIASEARGRGAETFTEFDSEQLWYQAMEELPLDWLRAPNRVPPALMSVSTARISITGVGDPRRMARIPPDRWEANSIGAETTYKSSRSSRVRTVELALGLLTAERARVYGYDLAGWRKSVLESIGADYAAIARKGKEIAALLAGAAEGRLTAPGTDLAFRFSGRKPRVYDGIVDDEDLELGNSSTSLPTGAIAVACDEASANGSVEFDLPVPKLGKLVHGLRWEFEDGNLARHSAEKNFDAWGKALIAAGTPRGSRKFAGMMIGLNPRARLGYLSNDIVRGAVSVGFGDNEDLGGANRGGFPVWQTLGKSTLEIDGKTVVKNGKLVR